MKYLPLFVYGTLRNGFHNHDYFLRDKTEKETNGTISARMYDVGTFPAVVCGDGTVHGELMYIKPTDYVDIMKACDRLEGCNPDADVSMYERQIIEVTTDEGSTSAWVYIWKLPTSRMRTIPRGDWAEYSAVRRKC